MRDGRWSGCGLEGDKKGGEGRPETHHCSFHTGSLLTSTHRIQNQNGDLMFYFYPLENSNVLLYQDGALVKSKDLSFKIDKINQYCSLGLCNMRIELNCDL